MFWIIIIIICAIIAAFLDSALGKVVAVSAVVALGLLLLSWITGFGFLITLAKTCSVIIVVAIVGAVLFAIIG